MNGSRILGTCRVRGTIAGNRAPDFSKNFMAQASTGERPRDSERVERLARRLGIAAIGLCALTAVLYALFGVGARLLELTWFNAFALTFQALTCLSAGYIAFGRYRALEDAASYWVGVAFCVYGTALVLYVLAWPGLLPEGGTFLAGLAGTAAWFTVMALAGLWVFLQLAARAQQSATAWVPLRSSAWTSIVAVSLTVLAGAVLIAAEHHLPSAVRDDGAFTPLLKGIYVVQIALFLLGTWVGVRQSRRCGDPLLTVTAPLQLALAFVLVWVIIGAGRYTAWWYLGRVGITAGALAVLFGLLAEHVTLLRRERERTAQLFAQSAELQRVNQALQREDQRKNEFLAMLSHELRNPLATIYNVLQVWYRAGAAPDAPLDALREAAVRQASHMGRLLDDLLDVARITDGRIRLDVHRLDLRAIVESAIEGFAHRLEEKRQRLGASLAAGVEVDGDALRLTQAVSNLLDNAIKYTSEGGSIEVALERRDGQALIRVADDGIGIPPDRIDEIFDLFMQAEPPLTRTGGGLGIGLTLTRSLIEMHRGSVQASSGGSGCGSEFVVCLPLAAGASQERPRAADGSPAGRPRRVLVVEDDADARQALVALLEELGHDVVSAPSGEAALEMAPSFRPDVVLLDLGLPGMDGYQTAERLRACAGTAALTVVALTGYGREEDRLRSRGAGFDRHLVKPVHVEALKDVLGAATDSAAIAR